MSHLVQNFVDQHVRTNHHDEEDNRDRRGVTYLETLAAVVLKMMHDRMCAVVNAGEAGEVVYDRTEVKGLSDRHNRTEEHLLLHVRKGYVPKLLPAVFDSVKRRRLIIRAVNSLETGDKGKECEMLWVL